MLLIGNHSINNNYNNCLLLVFLCVYYLSSEYHRIFVAGLSSPQLLPSDEFSMFLLHLSSLNTLTLCLPHPLSATLHYARYKTWLLSPAFQSLHCFLRWVLRFNPPTHSLIPTRDTSHFSFPPPLCSPLCPHVYVCLSIKCRLLWEQRWLPAQHLSPHKTWPHVLDQGCWNNSGCPPHCPHLHLRLWKINVHKQVHI